MIRNKFIIVEIIVYYRYSKLKSHLKIDNTCTRVYVSFKKKNSFHLSFPDMYFSNLFPGRNNKDVNHEKHRIIQLI